MDATTVEQYQAMLGVSTLPAALVKTFRTVTAAVDKISGGTVMSAYELAMIAHVSGVLESPDRLVKVEGPVEGEDEADFGLRNTIENPEKKEKKKRGWPKGKPRKPKLETATVDG